MVKLIRTVALATILSLTAMSCQKESLFDPEPSTLGEITLYEMCYVINGERNTITLYGDSELQQFIDQMLALAKNGYEVYLYNTSSVQRNSTKEQIIFHTHNEQEANNWALQKIQEGYDVSIEYNPRTGIYTCTAIR